MTFCLGMRTHEGLVGIADTLITSGNELTLGKKLTCINHGNGSLFLLTSGLRSVRDKTITYFEIKNVAVFRALSPAKVSVFVISCVPLL